MLKKLMTGAAAVAIMATAAHAERTLTFGLQNNETSNLYLGVAEFKETLESLSGGEMTVDIFANASLGDFKAMVEQVQAGELDMVMTGYPDMSYIIPELTLVGAPYVVDDFDHLERIVAGPWGQEMGAKMEEQNIHLVDVWYQGTRQTTSNKPINSMEDMAGLRLRTPGVPFLIAYAENTGATPAPVAFPQHTDLIFGPIRRVAGHRVLAQKFRGHDNVQMRARGPSRQVSAQGVAEFVFGDAVGHRLCLGDNDLHDGAVDMGGGFVQVVKIALCKPFLVGLGCNHGLVRLDPGFAVHGKGIGVGVRRKRGG